MAKQRTTPLGAWGSESQFAPSHLAITDIESFPTNAKLPPT